jgi:hypothetical protein
VLPQPTRTPLPESTLPIRAVNRAFQKLGNVLNFSSSHFFHNLSTSTLILPTTLVYDDLDHVMTPSQSYWGSEWQGTFSLGAALLFGINLLLIGIGIGWGWKRFRIAGLVPLVIALSYGLANALARTSGGRYIVPVDWIVYFYYALGLVQLSLWAAGWLFPGEVKLPIDQPDSVLPVSRAVYIRQSILVLLCFFAIGFSLKLPDSLFARVFTKRESKNQILVNWLPAGSLAQLGVQDAQLQAFLQDPNSVVLVGRVLYPRFYRAGKGESDAFSQNAKRPYPRMVFNLIGYRGNKGVVLSMNQPPGYFPQGGDAVVLGCAGKNGVEAYGVVFFRPEIKIYRNESSALLTCPLPNP